MPYLFAALTMVVLVAPFGAVEGKAVADDSGLTVEITVEVDRTFEAVLVRPFSSFEELPPTALQPIGNDMWGGLVTLPTAEDWNIVFDGLEAGGETFRSDSVTLTEIGVDPVVVAGEPVRLPDRAMDTATWWLIGGIAGALSALAALAWWTFGSDATESEVLDRGESDHQPKQRET